MNALPPPEKPRAAVRLFTVLPVVLGGLLAFKILDVAGVISDMVPDARAEDAAPAAKKPMPVLTTAPKPTAAAAGPARSACDASAAIAQAAGLSQAEVRVLQNLSARRSELEQREVELDTREKLLDAAEGKLDARVAELKTLKSQIDGLLGQVDGKRKAEIDSLVRIYQKMKPKDAARILETLDEDLAVQVTAGMKDQAAALILAAMSPERARRLTTRLATRTPAPKPAP
jgi:flagellar motility protein MotE (MotC chaperone)